MDVYVNGQKHRLHPQSAIGKGGEADVFDIGQNLALKLFKPPSHPDYQGLPHEQAAAEERLMLMQQKLPQFPPGLPGRVVAPIAIATDRRGSGGKIVGYTMTLWKTAEVLLKYTQPGMQPNRQLVVQWFLDLAKTLTGLHAQQVVIGDFNDLNVLIWDDRALLIDADSFQFGNFPCKVFTARFVDPLLCDPNANQPLLVKPYSPESDWYAFTVMLMQCLLYVNPYGGVYKPKTASQRLPHAARPLHRISVFHDDVVYPKPATPYTVLPDDLLQHFYGVFECDRRGPFLLSLIETLTWTTCPQCHQPHARATCPQCATGITILHPALQTATQVVRGTATATPVFATEGRLLYATISQGQLCWVMWNQEEYRREDGSVALTGALSPRLRWGIQAETTLVGQQGQIIALRRGSVVERLAADSLGALVEFHTGEAGCYWMTEGALQGTRRFLSTAAHAPLLADLTRIGQVLPGQTHLWVGAHIGFGFYSAGNLRVAFVFDPRRPGLNDRVELPLWSGQLIEATCSFSDTLCWFFLTTQENGVIHYSCTVIRSTGAVLATAKVPAGADHWLTHLGGVGAALPQVSPYLALNQFLLAATDEGIIRVEVQQDQLVKTKTFPDTEPFVDSRSHLLPAKDGLYVITAHTIHHLKMH